MSCAVSGTTFARILFCVLFRLAGCAGFLLQQYGSATFPRSEFGLNFFADLLNFIGMRKLNRTQQLPDR